MRRSLFSIVCNVVLPALMGAMILVGLLIHRAKFQEYKRPKFTYRYAPATQSTNPR